jgi:3-deoxy-7-phosphoheptulonate synthase
VAAGADGLIIEVHPEPSKALSDGMQSLYLEQFTQLINKLQPVAMAIGRDLDIFESQKNSGIQTICVE